MAGTLVIVDTEGEEALAAATAETVVQVVAPTNIRLKIKGYGVFFDGTSVTAEPVQVRLIRQTTAGTSSAGTPRRIAPSGAAETLQTTSRIDFSVEPTLSDVLDVVEVHPQGGYEKQFVLGQEPDIAGGGRVGIECTAPATVNVRAKIIVEE